MPCKGRPHQLIPNRFPDPSCVYCGGVNSEEHFVRPCPFKHEIWQTISSRFFVDPAKLTLASFNFLLPLALKSLLCVTYLNIIASVLLSLWQLHWRFIFEEHQFWPQKVVARATRQIFKIYKENISRLSQS
jgi:hypothetical protein